MTSTKMLCYGVQQLSYVLCLAKICEINLIMSGPRVEGDLKPHNFDAMSTPARVPQASRGARKVDHDT